MSTEGIKVTVKQITDIGLVQKLISNAYRISSKMDTTLLYKRSHTIQRAMLFYILLENIPSFVSVHLVRHSGAGQFHLVSSNRDDWFGVDPEKINRLTPVTHQMILNAEHLRSMAAVRLCGASHRETRKVMGMIKLQIGKVDPALPRWMVPKCFPTGWCNEAKCCGKVDKSQLWRDWRDIENTNKGDT